jgi:hypothetical protein
MVSVRTNYAYGNIPLWSRWQSLLAILQEFCTWHRCASYSFLIPLLELFNTAMCSVVMLLFLAPDTWNLIHGNVIDNKRLTHMSWFFQSPDGYTVASAAGDETLRFWQVFGTPETTKTTIKAKSKNMGSALNSLNRIR